MNKENLTLKIKKLDNCVSIPKYQTQGASAMDLVAAIDDDVIIPPGEIGIIPTGIAIELPRNTEAQVRSRSGMAIKKGVAVVNGIGTIDEDYRGEICVGLINHSKVDFKVSRGDRIAQMAVMEVLKPVIIETDELSNTQRATGGFGSTGVK